MAGRSRRRASAYFLPVSTTIVERKLARTEPSSGVIARQKRNVSGQSTCATSVGTEIEQFGGRVVGRRVRQHQVESEGFNPVPVPLATADLHTKRKLIVEGLGSGASGLATGSGVDTKRDSDSAQ